MSFFRFKQFLLQTVNPLSFADRILIIILLMVGLVSFIFLLFHQISGETVNVYIDNKLKYSFRLQQNHNQQIITPYGFIELKINNGKVWIEKSSCYTKICIKMGKITKASQSIVCVPNHVFLQIEGKNKENWIDAITY